MAHNLYTNEKGIVSAAYATGKNGLPWHALGQMVENAMTWKEAYELAKLNWMVNKEELFIKNRLWTPGSTEEKGFKVPGQFAVTRDDIKGPNSVLGIVGNTYEPTQNIEIGGWIDNVLEQIDGAHYEAAGVLGHGERVWALARVPFNATIGDDKHETYILFMSAHDGTMSNTIMLTDVRVVCQNTLNFALSRDAKDAMIKVRHTSGAKDKLNQITEDIQTGLKQDVDSLKEKFEKIIDWKINPLAISNVFDKVLGDNWHIKDESKIRDKKVARITELMQDNDNNAIPEQKGTGMALLNAVTNFVDHERTSRVTSSSGYSTMEQARADSSWVGSGATLKQNTLELILEEVETPDTSNNPNPSVQISDEKKETINNIMDIIG